MDRKEKRKKANNIAFFFFNASIFFNRFNETRKEEIKMAGYRRGTREEREMRKKSDELRLIDKEIARKLMDQVFSNMYAGKIYAHHVLASAKVFEDIKRKYDYIDEDVLRTRFAIVYDNLIKYWDIWFRYLK